MQNIIDDIKLSMLNRPDLLKVTKELVSDLKEAQEVEYCEGPNCTDEESRNKFVAELPQLGWAFKVGVGTYGVTPGVAISFCPFCGRKLCSQNQ